MAGVNAASGQFFAPAAAGPYLAAATGAVATTIKAKLGEAVSVRDFGAKGDGATDDTAALQAAEDWAAAQPYLPRLFFPRGRYMAHGVVWKQNSLWVGEETGGGVQIVYNGTSSAPGTYVAGIVASSGGVAYGGFENLSFHGYDLDNPSGHIAENCVQNLGVGTDWGFKIENIRVAYCWGDALALGVTGKQLFNLHLGRVRFDGVGGFCVYLVGTSGGSGHPFTMSRWTLDNVVPSALASRAAALGLYDGSRWCKGIARMVDCAEVGCLFTDARVELNSKLIVVNGVTALFHIENSVAGTKTIIGLKRLYGDGRDDQITLGIKDTTGRAVYTIENCSISSVTKWYESPTLADDLTAQIVHHAVFSSLPQQERGLHLGAQRLDFHNATPDDTDSSFWKRGDLIFSPTASPGRATGWTCVAPTTGVAKASVAPLVTGASCTSGSANVTVSSLRKFPVGLNITLVGAGGGASNLDCRVTGYDEPNGKIVVSVAPSTTVTGTLAINSRAASFTPLAYMPGTADNNGDSGTTLTAGIDAPVQKWASALTADRTITLAVTSIYPPDGAMFLIRRESTATGVFNLDAGGLIGLRSPATWAMITYDNSNAGSPAWKLIAAGSLVAPAEIATASVNPASVASGAATAPGTVTVPGAVPGDFAEASFSLDVQGLMLSAWVSSANTVSYRFNNLTGGAIDLAAGTLRVKVTKATT